MTRIHTYEELEALEPEAYLNPGNFLTPWDALDSSYSRQQYEKGMRIGQEASTVYIAINGTWSARMKDGSHISSYEGIGYHSGTSALLKGFLDSGCRVSVYRRHLKGETVIKEGKHE